MVTHELNYKTETGSHIYKTHLWLIKWKGGVG